MTVIKPRDEATAMQMIEIAMSDEQKAAIKRLYEITQLAQAMLFCDGELNRDSEFHQRIVDRLDAPTLVHDWEIAERLFGDPS